MWGSRCNMGPMEVVYVLDWSDTGECHHTRNTQLDTGRVFKIVYGKPGKPMPDMQSLSNDDLADLHLHTNECMSVMLESIAGTRCWRRQHALRSPKAARRFPKSSRIPRRLRALWTLWSIQAIQAPMLRGMLSDRDEHIRTGRSGCYVSNQ